MTAGKDGSTYDPFTNTTRWPPEPLRCQCSDPWAVHAGIGFVWETPMAKGEYGGWWHTFMGYDSAELDHA